MPVQQGKYRKFHNLGLSFHGLATNGILALPNGGTMPVPVANGPSLVVQHPSAPGVTRTAEEQAADTAQGREWRTYGLLSGPQRYLGGQGLGGGGWIYIDPAGVRWWLEAYFEIPQPGSQSREYVIMLKARFGHLGTPGLPAINRELYRETYTFDGAQGEGPPWNWAALGSLYPPADYDDWELFSVPNRDGSKVLNTVYESQGGVGGPFGIVGNVAIEIDLFEITGTGSTAIETLGDGIAATRVEREYYPNFRDYSEPVIAINTVVGEPDFRVSGSSGNWVVERHLMDQGDTVQNAANYDLTEEFCYGAIFDAAGNKEKIRIIHEEERRNFTNYAGSGFCVCVDQTDPGRVGTSSYTGLSVTYTRRDVERYTVSGGGFTWNQESGDQVAYPLTPEPGTCISHGSGCMCSWTTPVDPPPFGTPTACALGYVEQDRVDADADFAANHVPDWGAPSCEVQNYNGSALLQVFPNEGTIIGLDCYLASGDAEYKLSGSYDFVTVKAINVAHNPFTGALADNTTGASVSYW